MLCILKEFFKGKFYYLPNSPHILTDCNSHIRYNLSVLQGGGAFNVTMFFSDALRTQVSGSLKRTISSQGTCF